MTIYALLLEEDVQAGDALIYWGYAHFHPALEGQEEFLILYCRPARAQARDLNRLIIGVAARARLRGEVIQWNPEGNTEDVINNLQTVPAMPGTPREEDDAGVIGSADGRGNMVIGVS